MPRGRMRGDRGLDQPTHAWGVLADRQHSTAGQLGRRLLVGEQAHDRVGAQIHRPSGAAVLGLEGL